jgi:hypothetical protein
MSKPIPPVPAELIIKAAQQVTDDHERYGSAEPTISVIRAFAKTHSPDELLAVTYRLGALAKLIKDGQGGKWTITVLHQDYKLVNEALLRAAAHAPLSEAGTVGEISFEPKAFLAIALEESEAEGTG